MRDLVLMTFNVRNSRGLDGRHVWWRRRRSTTEAIRRPQPDVVGLQEARHAQLRYLRSRLGEFDAVGAGRDDGHRRGEYCPVLWRRDRLRLEHWEVRWFSDTPRIPGSRGWGNRAPRMATLAWLADRSTGERFGVAVTHLDPASTRSRMRSGQALIGWLGAEPGVPWVVLGDLNATVGDPVMVEMQAAGWRDALADLPGCGPGAATTHSFSASVDGARIDHILVPCTWTVTRAEIVPERPLGRLASDHWRWWRRFHGIEAESPVRSRMGPGALGRRPKGPTPSFRVFSLYS